MLTIQFDFLVMRFHQNNDISTQVNHDPYLITSADDIYSFLMYDVFLKVRKQKCNSLCILGKYFLLLATT